MEQILVDDGRVTGVCCRDSRGVVPDNPSLGMQIPSVRPGITFIPGYNAGYQALDDLGR